MKTPLRLFAALALAAVAGSFLPAEDKKPAAPADGFKPLFNGKNFDGWVNVNCHPDTFFIKGDEIVTTGNPTGFLRTDKQYENFVLEFDWMHVEKEKMANSGLFVWGDPLPAVGTPYTRGIEVQVLINYAPKDGWATSHGDIFSIHGARCTPDRPHFKGIERCLPSENRVKGGGEWNHYKVTANDGAIKLEVNGKEVSGVSKCSPRKGYLALESEGAECHFKNIKVKELPSTNPKPEEIATVAAGHTSLFNGIDLNGWDGQGKEAWKGQGGKMVVAASGKSIYFYRSKQDRVTHGELIFDWKLPAKSSGAFWSDFGPVKLKTGADGTLQLVQFEKTTKGESKQLKLGSWNRTVITSDANNVKVTINGEEVIKVATVETTPAAPVTFDSCEGLEIMNVFFRKEKK